MEAVKERLSGLAESLIVILLAIMCITMLHMHEKNETETALRQEALEEVTDNNSGKFWENISDY